MGLGDTVFFFRFGDAEIVSIRSQLWGWEILYLHAAMIKKTMFQSAPSFGAGRYVQKAFYILTARRFQSAPSFGAGRYVGSGDEKHLKAGFQSAPSFGAGRYAAKWVKKLENLGFNPLPALGLGDTMITTEQVEAAKRFNPLPALGLGDTVCDPIDRAEADVSIRSQLWGWEIRWGWRGYWYAIMFQSAPSFGAGRYQMLMPFVGAS